MTHDARPPMTVIEPSRGWVSPRLSDLWEFRDLLYFMVWRDVKVRYKQTLLGILWAVIQPLAAMLIFSLFFGRLAKVPSEGVPYPLFCLAALVPWTFFANGLTISANSLVASSQLVNKVYFPRLIVPLASVLGGGLDLCLALLVLVGVLAYYAILPGASIAFLPVALVMAASASLGAGLWLSALNAQYRDVRHVIPFLTQLWMFATPVVYSGSLLPEPWRTLYGLNPMVGAVEGVRWSLLGSGDAPGARMAVSAAAAILLLTTGAVYFRQVERTFADVI